MEEKMDEVVIGGMGEVGGRHGNKDSGEAPTGYHLDMNIS
jgi:hypothetical protein